VAEKAIAAEAVLAALWRRRVERDPVLIVIDEAHNVCPREPGDEVTALATEHAARIAAEGRKFGLYLLVSTQRPHRVNDLVAFVRFGPRVSEEGGSDVPATWAGLGTS
jgi:DNA helicase HerA-like ATPase